MGDELDHGIDPDGLRAPAASITGDDKVFVKLTAGTSAQLGR
jgi:hypothetical protein